MLKACSMSKSIDRQAVKILKEKGVLILHFTFAFKISRRIEFSTKSVTGFQSVTLDGLYSNFPVTML